MTRPPRLAVLADYSEEGWVSMDLCADMLFEHLPRSGPDALAPRLIRPPFRRLLSGFAAGAGRRSAFNLDRIYNRFARYPRLARRHARDFDLFHVVDHSYSQLVHALPADRLGVYCHDIDAFRCVVDPAGSPRPFWFRAMAARLLAGLRRAALVFYSNDAVRDELLRFGVIDPGRLIHAPYGVSAEFTAGRPEGVGVPRWLEDLGGRPWLLHVGSCVPRKRMDVLLGVLAEVRRINPEVRLVKVGGEWSADHRAGIERLGLGDSILHVRGVPRGELAEAYRRAGAVLVPSEAEGFGLPVIEALSCGAPVLASDIPALREAGGPAASYAPVGDVAAWAVAASRLLVGPRDEAGRAGRLAWAGRFTWSSHAGIIARAYHGLL